MPRISRGRLREWQNSSFPRFCIVGGIGFVVDACILLSAVHGLGINPITGRLLSFSVAVWVTFQLNRHWAFRGRHQQRFFSAFARYLVIQGLGFACNFSVYTALYVTLAPPLNRPIFCLVISSALALVVNYTGAHFVVFRSTYIGKRDARQFHPNDTLSGPPDH